MLRLMSSGVPDTTLQIATPFVVEMEQLVRQGGKAERVHYALRCIGI